MNRNYILKLAELLEEVGTPEALVAANALEMTVFDNSETPDISRVAFQLAAFANVFDQSGDSKVSDHLDTILFAFADIEPRYNELYDVEKTHNNNNLYQGYHPKKVEVGEPAYKGLNGFNGAPTLLTRHSPELPGVHLLRVSDGVYQDSLTKKIYDFNNGWVGEDGKKYPGGSVANQTPSAQDWNGSFPRVFEGSPTQRPK